jgi:Homeodomain-like domain
MCAGTGAGRSRMRISLWTRSPRPRPPWRVLLFCKVFHVLGHIWDSPKCYLNLKLVVHMVSGDRSPRRLDAEQARKVKARILRRHARGETIRQIARAVNMPRTSVHRIVQAHHQEQGGDRLVPSGTPELELIELELAELVEELDEVELDVIPYNDPVALAVGAGQRSSRAGRRPDNALARYRLQHLPVRGC